MTPSPDDEIFNAADPEAVTRKTRAAQRAERTRITALAAVTATPEGRRLLRWLIDATGLLQPSFTGDAAHAFFAEGKRSIGLMLVKEIDTHCSGQAARILFDTNEESHG